MKTNRNILSLVASATFFTLPATAADPRPDQAVSSSEAIGRMDSTRAKRLDRPDSPVKASDLIGAKIENRESQKVGSIDELAIDLQAGQVVHVIISSGGFLAMGQHSTAVPPSVLRYDAAGKPLRMDLTAEMLKTAPAFESSRWTEYYQSGGVLSSYRHFGAEGSLAANSSADAGAAVEPGSALRRSGLGFVQKASKLMGLAVKNLQDETIGTIDNLIVDLPAGRVVAVIVSSGGFLGMGDTLSVVPPTALRFNAEHDLVRLDTTKEALAEAPRFKSGEWPDFSQRDYATSIYGAYRVKPYFAGDQDGATAPNADNSARNVRDRDDRTLTAGDQSDRASDVKITRDIRREVTAVDRLSVNAKNVKIITVNGRVTLRGPVRSADEKNLIGEIAVRATSVDRVDNQLEVTAP